MSCSFYAYTKNANIAFDMMPRVSMIENTREFKVHLCRTYPKMKPLFEVHGNFWTFSELCNYLQSHKDDIIIKNEFGCEKSIDEFIAIMKSVNDNQTLESRAATTITRGHIIADSDGFEFANYGFENKWGRPVDIEFKCTTINNPGIEDIAKHLRETFDSAKFIVDNREFTDALGKAVDTNED